MARLNNTSTAFALRNAQISWFREVMILTSSSTTSGLLGIISIVGRAITLPPSEITRAENSLIDRPLVVMAIILFLKSEVKPNLSYLETKKSSLSKKLPCQL